MADYTVDPDQLKSVGQSLQKAAGDMNSLPQQFGSMSAWARAAGRSDVAQAIADCVSAWEFGLTKLISDVTTLGKAFTDVRRGFSAVETAVIKAFEG